MAWEDTVEQIYRNSEQVLVDCALENGAIIAANNTNPDYPRTAESYNYSWGRDAAFQIVAAHQMRLPKAAGIRYRYMKWLDERCQDFIEDNTIVKRYHVNGAADVRYGREYQPDQAGLLLWSLHETGLSPDRTTDSIMRRLANGLVNNWTGTTFRRPVQDAWENITLHPFQEANFNYSLVAVIGGLGAAIDRLVDQGYSNERSRWQEARAQMFERLLSRPEYPIWVKHSSILGTVDERSVDSSLLVTAYPFEELRVPKLRHRTIATVKAIGQTLGTQGGIVRYEGDTYDGVVRASGREANGGVWPLISFWYTLAMDKLKQRELGLAKYNEVIDQLAELYDQEVVPRGYIPEQLFPSGDERQGRGPLPLGWAHAKFALATIAMQH